MRRVAKVLKLRRYVLLALAFLMGLPAAAQDSGLERLDTWGRNRGWEGVGLLNIAGRTSCTGVMIRPDMVLTAAHCLYDADTGVRVDPRQVEFRAGWRGGRAIAVRMGRAAVIHARYGGSDRLSGEQMRYDVALLQLAAPILPTHADPFRADGGVRTGDEVSVVSYGAGRNDAASRQRACEVLEAARGLVVMSCDVVPGSSGSPVFAMRKGRPRVVALVSAMGMVNGRQVSFGMDIEAPLADVLADFRAGRGVYPVALPSARRLVVGDGQSVGGARFIRP
ncbi:trypsin-like serine protease [Rhodobacteraceae bacterium R_SAG10]|jgi:V8-like Glu-specific endopeptidase|nr:trypsin-like serine protease [Rhodobacteraceae bacterium R_SAG10]